MDSFWLVVMFALGGLAGFVIFALLMVAREAEGKRQVLPDPIMLSLELESETITRR